MVDSDPVFVAVQGAARESIVAACSGQGQLFGLVRTGPLALRVNHNLRQDLRDSLSSLAATIGRKTLRQLAADCNGLCVAMSGVYQDGDFFAIRQLLADIGFLGDFEPVVCEDIWADLAAAGYSQGMVLLSSTGSNFVAGHPEGERIAVGGWGSEIGDPGSGYSVGIAAIRAMLASEDGRLDVSTDFTTAILARLRLTSIPQVVPWYQAVRRTDYWRAKIADLAIPVTQLHERVADQTATSILRQNGEELGQSLRCGLHRAFKQGCISPSAPAPLLVAGGLAIHSTIYWEVIVRECDAFSSTHPVTIVPTRSDYHPIVGALAFACSGSPRLLRQPVIESLRSSAPMYRLRISAEL